jgi:hypothetical protein
VPTRKQRRRRAKDRRHDYEYVYVDDAGREIEPPPDEPKPERTEAKANAQSKAKPAAGKGGAATKGGRTPRKVQPPSWNRALKRGLIWGAVLTVLLAFGLGSKTSNVAARILPGVLYTILFIPMVYFIDTMSYRAYVKRTGDTSQGEPPARRRKGS